MSDDRPSIPDPFAAWREWVSQSERQWNAFFNQVMGSDQYTQSMGRLMEMYVTAQKGLGDMLERYFTTLNLATRTDVLALGERLVGIENRLTAIEAALRAASPRDDALAAAAPSLARPPRTRKPPPEGARRQP